MRCLMLLMMMLMMLMMLMMMMRMDPKVGFGPHLIDVCSSIDRAVDSAGILAQCAESLPEKAGARDAASETPRPRLGELPPTHRS